MIKKKINNPIPLLHKNLSLPILYNFSLFLFFYSSHLNQFKNWYTSIQNHWRSFQYTITFSRYFLIYKNHPFKTMLCFDFHSFFIHLITCQIFTCLKILLQNHGDSQETVSKVFAIRLISMRRKREGVITGGSAMWSMRRGSRESHNARYWAI